MNWLTPQRLIPPASTAPTPCSPHADWLLPDTEPETPAMYRKTIDHLAGYATAKRDAVASMPVRFFIDSMMASAYVGLAIILVNWLGAAPAYRHLIMGASFGVGLGLLFFAGGELFTGRTMYIPHGLFTVPQRPGGSEAIAAIEGVKRLFIGPSGHPSRG
jgi:hypothetical protein